MFDFYISNSVLYRFDGFRRVATIEEQALWNELHGDTVPLHLKVSITPEEMEEFKRKIREEGRRAHVIVRRAWSENLRPNSVCRTIA